MAEEGSRPWGVHAVRDIFAPLSGCAAGLPDGRWVTAVCEPYSANRAQAAWWVLTGRAYAIVWPKPGDLENALGVHPLNDMGAKWHGGIKPLSLFEAQAAGEAMRARWKQNAGEPPFVAGDCAWYDLARTAFEAIRDMRAVVASVDTLPKGRDGEAGSVRSKGGAARSEAEGDAQP